MILRGGRRRLLLADRVHDASRPDTAGDCLLIADGRVEAVGRRAELEPQLGAGEALDFRGCTLTPGFIDAHIHLLDWAFARRQVDLTGVASFDAVEQRVRAALDTARAGWILGRGWSHALLGAEPDRAVLDRAAGAVPVALHSQDMHAVWANRAALERAGIDARTPDPDGGHIARRPDGSPAGVLYERASALLTRVVPPADETSAADVMLEAQRELHRFGVTGAHSIVLEGPMVPNPLRVLGALAEAGRLRLRVLQHLPVALLDEAIALGLRSGFGDDWLRIGGIKMFLDGTLGSRTALLQEPYRNSDDRGVSVLGADLFRDCVRRAAAAGLASTVHAIGDAAVALALDVLADGYGRGAALPHRIEHVQLAPHGRLADAGRAGIVCSMQPSHLMTDWQSADRHWGRERAARAYAFRSLAAAGAVLAFGSDAPVDPPDPRLGLFAATQRTDVNGEPDGGWNTQERLDRYEAFRAYTFGPGCAEGLAGRRGVLAPGALADVVAWQGDPLAVEPAELLELNVRATLVAGELVWQSS